MKRTATTFLLVLATLIALSQHTYTSICTGNDSVKRAYLADAVRLTLRYTYKQSTTFRDSIKPEQARRNLLWNALLAVYNATDMPVRDTLVDLYKIHTRPDPEIHTHFITANPANNWMMQLQANQPPTANAPLLALINKYQLQYTYYQTGGDDRVNFTNDSGLNLPPLLPLFKSLSGVVTATYQTGYNDVTEITDSVGTGFVHFTFSYGWKNCNAGCTYRRYWRIKVGSDCSVQYLGTSGDSFAAGLPALDNGVLNIFPSPASGELRIETPFSGEGQITIYSAEGGISFSGTARLERSELDISALPPGIYLVRIVTPEKQLRARFTKL